MDHHARVDVFGHGLGAESADFDQHTTAEQPAASREERAVMPITAGLKHTIEQSLLILEGSLKLQIFLKYVGIVEMVRRLDERDLFILEKSYRIFQETAGRDVIDVENRNDFSRCFMQGMVQVSSFRVLAIRPADVSTIQRRS